jgi:hypothetical protein
MTEDIGIIYVCAVLSKRDQAAPLSFLPNKPARIEALIFGEYSRRCREFILISFRCDLGY